MNNITSTWWIYSNIFPETRRKFDFVITHNCDYTRVSEKQITQNSRATSLLGPPRWRGGPQQEQPCCGKIGGTASASFDPGWHHGRLSVPTPLSGAHVRTSRHSECTTKPETHTYGIKVRLRHRHPISYEILTWSVYWELMISPTLILTLSCWKHSRSGEHNDKPIKPPDAALIKNFITCPGSHLCPYLCQKALLSLAPVLIQVSAPPNEKVQLIKKKGFTLFELTDAFLRTSYISFHTGLRFSLTTLLLNVNSPTLIFA